MSSVIPASQYLFQHTSRYGSLTWKKEGFADDPVFTLRVAGPAGEIELAVGDPAEFLTDIAEAVVNPELDRTALAFSDEHYIAFKFAKDLDVFEAEGDEDVELVLEPRAWGFLSDGRTVENRRGQVAVPAYLVIEVFTVDADADEGERLQLVAMTMLERPAVERFGWKLNEELQSLLAS